MALIGRKEQPTTSDSSTTQPRDKVKPRTVPAGPGTGSGENSTRVGRMQGRISAIMAELRKVTWPTREETRNLTIVVIGISAVVGALLSLLDVILSYIYTSLNGITF